MLDLLAMWALVEAIGIIFLPLTTTVFHNIPDRGWAWSKALGIAILAFCIWLPLMVLHFLTFTRIFVLGVLLLLLILNVISLPRTYRPILQIIKSNPLYIVVTECVFLGMVFVLGLVRSYTPDIRSFEMYMDEGFLASILRSAHFPPHDMWYAGASINYYYYMHYVVAMLARLLDQPAAIAFNTGISMLFGLTAVSLFGLSANLITWAKRLRNSVRAETYSVRAETSAAPTEYALVDPTSSVGGKSPAGTVRAALVSARTVPSLVGGIPFGLLTMVMALVLGNMQSAIAFFTRPKQDWYDWFAPSRVIKDTANEFPSFSFLLSDFHAHTLTLAFTALAMGLALSFFLRSDGKGLALFGRGWQIPITLASAAIVLGGLFVMNGWDLPTYLGLAVLCIILQQWLNHDRQFSVTLLRDICYAVVPLVALSYLFFLPFYRHYIAPTGGIGLVEAKDRTTLHDELLIYGLFAFVFLSLLATSIWSQPLLAAGRAKTSAGRAKTSAGRAKTSAGRAKTSCAPTAATASELKDEDHAEPIAKENEPKIEKNEIPVTDEHEILVAEDSVRSAVAVGAELVSAPTATADLTSDPTDTTDGYFSWPLIGMLAGSGFFIIGLAMNFISPQNATVFVMLGLTIIGAVQTLRHLDDRAFAFTLLAGTLACALVTGCEIIFLRDAFVNSQPRYNTVFKFYIQAWILLSISCGAGLYFILCRIKAIRSMSRMTNALQWSGKIIWALCLIALLGMSAVYPIVAPYYRVMRYDPKTGQGGVYQSSSLDGMAYFKYDQYHIGDYEAIHWLNANVPDDSVIVEAVYNNDYSDFGRVSSFTGLQTIMGWIGHEYQWRMGSDVQSASLLPRQHDVDAIYTSTNQQQVVNTMKRYHAQYLYVGLLEHIRYPNSNLERFKAFMQAVYQNNNVTIYKLKQ